jgi:REP element-mobilizing transposase RayT
MNKFENKYRIESNRLHGWDYSNNGYYFITIVSENRINWFGEIIERQMNYSDFGKIVLTEWNKSFQIRSELFLNEFILMPNHLHAIIVLKNTDFGIDVETHGRDIVETHGRYIVETHGRASLQYNENTDNPVFERKPKSISSFVAGVKSATINKIDDFIDEHNLYIPKYNRNNHFFQPDYHDHIIRNENEYNRIFQYIIDNPVKWETDKLNTRERT